MLETGGVVLRYEPPGRSLPPGDRVGPGPGGARGGHQHRASRPGHAGRDRDRHRRGCACACASATTGAAASNPTATAWPACASVPRHSAAACGWNRRRVRAPRCASSSPLPAGSATPSPMAAEADPSGDAPPPLLGRHDMIRVLLAEDQAMVRGALAALLDMEPDIEVLGSAPDGEAAWRELQRLKPDLLVTDIEMPGLTGLELAQRVQRHELPVQGGDRDHLRAPRLPAPGAGCGRARLPAQGCAGRETGRVAAHRASRRPRHRSGAGGGSLVGGRPAQRSRTPGAAPGRAKACPPATSPGA